MFVPLPEKGVVVKLVAHGNGSDLLILPALQVLMDVEAGLAMAWEEAADRALGHLMAIVLSLWTRKPLSDNSQAGVGTKAGITSEG